MEWTEADVTRVLNSGLSEQSSENLEDLRLILLSRVEQLRVEFLRVGTPADNVVKPHVVFHVNLAPYSPDQEYRSFRISMQYEGGGDHGLSGVFRIIARSYITSSWKATGSFGFGITRQGKLVRVMDWVNAIRGRYNDPLVERHNLSGNIMGFDFVATNERPAVDGCRDWIVQAFTRFYLLGFVNLWGVELGEAPALNQSAFPSYEDFNSAIPRGRFPALNMPDAFWFPDVIDKRFVHDSSNSNRIRIQPIRMWREQSIGTKRWYFGAKPSNTTTFPCEIRRRGVPHQDHHHRDLDQCHPAALLVPTGPPLAAAAEVVLLATPLLIMVRDRVRVRHPAALLVPARPPLAAAAVVVLLATPLLIMVRDRVRVRHPAALLVPTGPPLAAAAVVVLLGIPLHPTVRGRVRVCVRHPAALLVSTGPPLAAAAVVVLLGIPPHPTVRGRIRVHHRSKLSIKTKAEEAEKNKNKAVEKKKAKTVKDGVGETKVKNRETETRISHGQSLVAAGGKQNGSGVPCTKNKGR
ncbi:hypothetical protein VSDG_04752 [Cytospora chrysosperma]|uniref:Uncharacterized protein n=1 Tax=Cytospora chrysosperma TaxID=252740 RepID=A0A423W1L9_CYTCH|nr:hypothetical protein VSDG_04752 [Valsa sordida]